MYNYNAKLIKVVDGDTVDLEIDLGFKIFTTQRFRLLGLNAPETRGEEREEGLKSKKWLEQKLKNAKTINVQSYKTGKYGRWLANIYIVAVGETVQCINDLMIKEGFATER